MEQKGEMRVYPTILFTNKENRLKLKAVKVDYMGCRGCIRCQIKK